MPADLSDPESGTAPTVASGEGGERDRRHADCRKYEATVQAQAALAGVRVIPVEGADGRRAYLVGRWSLTRPCDTLEDVTAFLQKMGIRT